MSKPLRFITIELGYINQFNFIIKHSHNPETENGFMIQIGYLLFLFKIYDEFA